MYVFINISLLTQLYSPGFTRLLRKRLLCQINFPRVQLVEGLQKKPCDKPLHQPPQDFKKNPKFSEFLKQSKYL